MSHSNIQGFFRTFAPTKREAIIIFGFSMCIEVLRYCLNKNDISALMKDDIFIFTYGTLLLSIVSFYIAYQWLKIIWLGFKSGRLFPLIAVIIISVDCYFRLGDKIIKYTALIRDIFSGFFPGIILQNYRLIISTLAIISLFLLLYFLCMYCLRKMKSGKGILLLDKPITKKSEDKLDYYPFSETLETIIYNNGDPSPKVISLENQWGEGKSSVINFVKDIVKEKRGGSIVYEFNAWHFYNDEKLFESFLIGLGEKIQQKYYSPSINSLFDTLLNILTFTKNFDWGGVVSFGNSKYDLKTLFEKIQTELESLDVRIIVIMDDLDRVSLHKAKQVFQILEICRNFYGVTFLVCFDSNSFSSIEDPLKITRVTDTKGSIESISQEEIDPGYIKKYLSKIVTIKYVLPRKIGKIKTFFEDTFLMPIDGTVLSVDCKNGIKEGVDLLYSHENYDIFGKYVSNIRDIKRLYNFFLSRFIGKEVVLQNLFDRTNRQGLYFEDFIKMMIVFMHHDNIYQRMLEEGTSIGDISYKVLALSGKGSLFLAEYDYNGNQTKYKHKKRYDDYVSNLSPSENKMISNMFQIDNSNKEESYRTLSFRLDAYLDVFSEVENIDRNYFITQLLKKFLSENKGLDSLFTDIIGRYNFKGVYQFLDDFSKIKTRSKNGSENKQFELLIDYMLNTFYKYTVNQSIGIYDSIAKVLDNSVHSRSKIRNPAMIGRYVYNEGEFQGRGIFFRLLSNDWGVKGLFIALYMRHCLLERNYFQYEVGVSGLDSFNGKEDFEILGKQNTYIWNLFKKEYIEENINIFEKIDTIPDNEFNDDAEGVRWNGPIGKQRFKNILLIYLSSIQLNDGGTWKDIKDDLFEYIKNCFQDKEFVRQFLEFLFITIESTNQFNYDISEEESVLVCKLGSILGFLDNDPVKAQEKIKELLSIQEKFIGEYLEENGESLFQGYGETKFSYRIGYNLFLKTFLESQTSTNVE